MPALPLYDVAKKKIGTVELNDKIFAAEVAEHLIHDAVRLHAARKYELRTSRTLTRGEISATTKKAYRQKGTGQARHGNEAAPIFVGGSKAHGPKLRRVIRKMNKRVAAKALVSALSKAQKEDRLFIIDKLELEKHSTKSVVTCLSAFGLDRALIVNINTDKPEQHFNRSISNIKDVKNLQPEGLNVFDILKYRNLVFSQKAVEKISERLSHV